MHYECILWKIVVIAVLQANFICSFLPDSDCIFSVIHPISFTLHRLTTLEEFRNFYVRAGNVTTTTMADRYTKLLILPIKEKRCHVGFFPLVFMFNQERERKTHKHNLHVFFGCRSPGAIQFNNNKLMIFQLFTLLYMVVVFEFICNATSLTCSCNSFRSKSNRSCSNRKLLTNLWVLISMHFNATVFGMCFFFRLPYRLFFHFGVCFHFGCIYFYCSRSPDNIEYRL